MGPISPRWYHCWWHRALVNITAGDILNLFFCLGHQHTSRLIFMTCQAPLHPLSTLYSPSYLITIFAHLKLCLATATHNKLPIATRKKIDSRRQMFVGDGGAIFKHTTTLFSLSAHSNPGMESYCWWRSGAVFSYKLRYIVGFWLVEMAISTNQKPTIYRNLYKNTAPDQLSWYADGAIIS